MKFVFSCFIFFVGILCTASCSHKNTQDTIGQNGDSMPGSATHDSAVSKIIPPVKRALPDSGLFCFYVFNNKYAGSPDSLKVLKWVPHFLDSLGKNGIDPSSGILGTNGGGPMGAQWNPGADILVVGCFETGTDTNSMNGFVNDYDIQSYFLKGKIKAQDGNHYFFWYIIPYEKLDPLRHLPSKEEVNTISALHHLDPQNWIKNSCTVMKITATAKKGKQEVKLEDYLVLSYGE